MARKATKAVKQESEHWLVRPETIRKIWIWSIIALVTTVALELFTGTAGHFHGLDELFGFPAIFGFLSCVAMVFGAKLLGFILKRKDDYYDL
jgi:hypothetical protein